ncbi:MAG TPA: 5-formyltetrahydrofolate cyclo-ligase [Nevskiaceae bacterium]|nr:5-formyltetrahydrofolate cyclo-ligase [Nevskiaceae bacterium]
MRAELRRWRRSVPIRARRAAATRVAQRALRLRQLRSARRVAAYSSCGGELDTLPLLHALQAHGTAVYIPRIPPGSHRITFVRWSPRLPLHRPAHGHREPAVCRPLLPARRLQLVFVPLLAFDAHGGRLGQGGGYYDRCFAGRRGHRPRLVGHAYAGQQRECVPAAPWDVRLDAVLTERGLLRCEPATCGAGELQ